MRAQVDEHIKDSYQQAVSFLNQKSIFTKNLIFFESFNLLVISKRYKNLSRKKKQKVRALYNQMDSSYTKAFNLSKILLEKSGKIHEKDYPEFIENLNKFIKLIKLLKEVNEKI